MTPEEAAVIGACLLDGRVVRFAVQHVMPSDFSTWEGEEIFSAICWVHATKQAQVDTVTVASRLAEGAVILKHAFRNALIPITTIVAFDFAGLIGGAIITEQVFGWSAMGNLLIEGLREYDVNIVLAWMMVTGVIVIVFNLIADLLYGVLDPRIRQ